MDDHLLWNNVRKKCRIFNPLVPCPIATLKLWTPLNFCIYFLFIFCVCACVREMIYISMCLCAGNEYELVVVTFSPCSEFVKRKLLITVQYTHSDENKYVLKLCVSWTSCPLILYPINILLLRIDYHVLVNGSVSLNHAAEQLTMYGGGERPVTIKHTWCICNVT